MVELNEMEVTITETTDIVVDPTATATAIEQDAAAADALLLALQEDDGDSQYEDDDSLGDVDEDDDGNVVVRTLGARDILGSDYGSDATEDDDEDEFEEDEDLARESLLERISALRDVIPPTTRVRVVKTVTRAVEATWGAAQWVGSAAWVVSTAVMLVGLPVALELEREQFVFQQEAQMRVQQQQAQQMVQPGLGGLPGGAPPQIPGLPAPKV
ncbi:mitochondrial import receptor subunit Tom22-domain-containing protein [Fimicolochytrium jonesii]|uniref:mitochondrial import receptor subunit Tom22-domain-containing protein n=1 Tax=Fimicolochytrium jonesii TaxID=1396493 RepID=UPI0022FE16C2|nr:mitochondrial import receptor subunit Tom22-domain-containing protein [Fimicolochytrium jonesii]KAI8826265.1 mitochondrial import receptor subunit Tom22-domain-containing protein [Fimicolochytrium jonesii]